MEDDRDDWVLFGNVEFAAEALEEAAMGELVDNEDGDEEVRDGDALASEAATVDAGNAGIVAGGRGEAQGVHIQVPTALG